MTHSFTRRLPNQPKGLNFKECIFCDKLWMLRGEELEVCPKALETVNIDEDESTG